MKADHGGKPAIKFVLGVALIGSLLVAAPSQADAAPRKAPCTAIDHRGSSGLNDDNTLEGQANNAAHGVITEADLISLAPGQGSAVFHQKVWDQGTSGTGEPSTTSRAYADSLVTDTYHQQVPLGSQWFSQLKANGGRAIVEIHYWPTWDLGNLQRVVDFVRAKKLQGQIYWTGTNGALKALRKMAPHFTLMYRPDVGKVYTQAMATAMGVSGIQASSAFLGPVKVRSWRAHGFFVWGRQSNADTWARGWAQNMWTQQSNTPITYLRSCRAYWRAHR